MKSDQDKSFQNQNMCNKEGLHKHNAGLHALLQSHMDKTMILERYLKYVWHQR